MIKLNFKGTAPDCTEHGSVSTDCKTVGEFMTEAASIYGGELTIKVDGCRYEFSDNQKIKVADYTPIDEVTYASVPGRMTFIVRTKPKPKTVKKSGWVNIYSGGSDRYCGYIWDSKDNTEWECNAERTDYIATARIEWEEAIL